MSRYSSSTLHGSQYRPVKQINDYQNEYDVDKSNGNHYMPHDLSAYSDESNHYQEADNKNFENNEMIYNHNSQFYEMDPQLVGFVKKYNVVMNDGAVMNKAAMDKMASMQIKEKKKFQPPGGLSLTTFIFLVVILILSILIIIALSAVGIAYVTMIVKPKLPRATPWWRRSQMYHINVATWANDIGGPVGRLQDVTPRMAYVTKNIGATSIVLTNLVSFDKNGIVNWNEVSQSVDPDGEAFTTHLPQLVKRANKPMGPNENRYNPINIVLGLPIYATSVAHRWFKMSQDDVSGHFGNFYMWTEIVPKTNQERRYFAYNSVRKSYYRHVHGNSESPLLNLTNVNVQNELIKVIGFWKEKLKIKGIVIKNSTNLLKQFVPDIKTILDQNIDDDYIWFADDPEVNALFGPDQKVCTFNLAINHRVPTRTNDLNAQLMLVLNESLATSCSPIWQIVQLSEDNKDLETVQKLARFLPGSFLMMAGQEVDIIDGNENLMKWSSTNYLDYTTYWPQNKMLPEAGKQRLNRWKYYWKKTEDISLLNTANTDCRLVVLHPKGSDNLFAIYRGYRNHDYRIYFIVSFQTLNRIVRFNAIFDDLNSPEVAVSYDSKRIYSGRRVFGDNSLTNNQILLLYYY